MATFSRYNLVRRIGVGGMAEVWKAKAQGPEGFEKTVAIKKVLPELADNRDFIAMFVEEAKLVADLVHPNIVQVFDFGRAGPGEYFIAMEYVGGQNLTSLIARAAQRGTKIPLEVGLFVATECAKGLAYAHSKRDAAGTPLKIVHRDMSPANILVSFGGEVKITDFGIAKAKTTVERTEVGIVRGNAAYLSPEQARMEPLDQRSDIFTLGVVMFELFTGHRLFRGMNLQDLVAQAAQFRFPAEETARLPMSIQQVLQSTLRSDPTRRFQDATELEEALEDVLGEHAGRNEARRALIALMAGLFEEERRAELGPEASEPSAEKSISLSPRRTGEIAEQRPPTRPIPPRSGAVRAGGGTDAEPGTMVMPGASAEAPAEDGGPYTMAIPASNVVVEESKPRSAAIPIARPVDGPSAPTVPRDPPRRARTAALTGIALLVFGAGAAAIALQGRLSGPAPSPPATTTVARSTATVAAAAATTASVAPTPEPSHTRVAVAPQKKGRLVVNAAPWCRVLVDGKKVADETPVDVSIAAGRRVIRFENPVLKLTATRTVDVKPGERIEFFVDASTKKISLTRE